MPLRPAQPTLEHTEFFPNRDVADALRRAVHRRPGQTPLRLEERRFRERRAHTFRSGVALVILIPLNSAPSGLLRALGPPAETSDIAAFRRLCDAIDLRPQSRHDDVARVCGVGSVARYVAGSSSPPELVRSISSRGFLALENLEEP
ncbi:hypothetical protein [Curtobacterium sp. VKM Ac-2922]|uniref:hypothetical protein n=1 Tax=Curtobacterium sp. VKM Ac-2922 TaxID=2929475 RepID=UPI001FB4EA2F|nr:hypothetical protein [Curtobacterium sp. VKM Ac-2922]MCJ1712642.1 hypothetical protein [Curtobacterium sp. VKM Ac-2922]